MKKILIVEGNLREENQSFSEAGIQTHTESLKDSLAFFTDKLETHVVNPSSYENIDARRPDGKAGGCPRRGHSQVDRWIFRCREFQAFSQHGQCGTV